jgi:hypothetical protein
LGFPFSNVNSEPEQVRNTEFVVRFWGVEYRDKGILNITVLRFWGGEYREELTLNVTPFVTRIWGRGI